MAVNLRQLLNELPWPVLRFMARRRGLPVSSSASKERLVARLAVGLANLDGARRAVAGLGAPDKELLADLLAAGGSLPLDHARRLYGSLRPLRQVMRLWPEEGVSPLERLALLGLVFYHPPTQALVIPPAVAQALFPVLNFKPLAPLPARPAVTKQPSDADWLEPALTARHDVAALLGLLTRHRPVLIQKRWLPPTFLAAWGDWCAQPPAHPRARSERQTERRRFLHFLAQGAGLVEGPVVTPAGRRWLKAPAQTGLQRLWQAGFEPDANLWRTFGLPGADWLAHPAPFLAGLLSFIKALWGAGDSSAAAMPVAALARLAVLRRPDLLDFVPAGAENPAQLPAGTIQSLARGPLAWLGALVIAGKDNGAVSLSAWGAHWLGLEPAPPSPPPQAFTLSPSFAADPLDSTFTLARPPGLPHPAWLAAAILMSRKPARQKPVRRLQITAASFVSALHQGRPAPRLAQALAALAGRELTTQEQSLLFAWSQAAQKMVIHPLLVLEVSDPAVISRLAAARRGRAHIVRSLSARAVVVNGFKLAPLTRRLTAQEKTPPQVVGVAEPDREIGGTAQTAAYTWLALRVYQALGEFIDLPVQPPPDLPEGLQGQLDEESLAAAEGAAAQTIQALKGALVGRLAFPPWPEEGLAVAQTLPLIERAIAQGQALRLTYYALSTNTVTRRVVEPHRVEWWGASATEKGTPYLVGYCRQAGAARHFRLDRIREIRGVNPAAGAGNN